MENRGNALSQKIGYFTKKNEKQKNEMDNKSAIQENAHHSINRDRDRWYCD